MCKLTPDNRAANSIVEYSIILMVVAIALTVMNTYIKRGLQGGLKDMADGFIGSGNSMQAADANPTANTVSNQTTNSNSTFTDQMFLGGSRETGDMEASIVNAQSTVTDTMSGQANPGAVGGVSIGTGGSKGAAPGNSGSSSSK